MYCFSTLEQFSKLRESVRQELKQLLASEAESMFVAINEAVNNAIFHGNSGDSTKKVYLTITSSQGEIKAIIRDEGRGLDSAQNSSTCETLQESGRGLEIIGFCVDCYYFNVQPSEIVLIKKITTSPLGVEENLRLKKERVADAYQYQCC